MVGYVCKKSTLSNMSKNSRNNLRKFKFIFFHPNITVNINNTIRKIYLWM